MLGDEVHALGLCGRAVKDKVNCMVDFLDLVNGIELNVELPTGNVWDLIVMLHMLPPELHSRAWRLVSLVTKAIDETVFDEDPHRI